MGSFACCCRAAATTDPNAQINATQAVTLASAAVSDMRGFCDRQPTACKVGGKVAVALGHKAEAGARTLIGFVTSKMSEQTGSVRKTAAADAAAQRAQAGPAQVVTVSAIDHGTLKASDLAPAFHVKVPLPPRRQAPRGRPSVKRRLIRVKLAARTRALRGAERCWRFAPARPI